MADFEITKVRAHVFFYSDNNIHSLEIFVPKNHETINTKDGRRQLENDNFEFGTISKKFDYWKNFLEHNENDYGKLRDITSKYRWPAGGLLQVVGNPDDPTDQYALLLLRDEGAPSYPLHFTIGSGLGKHGEIYNPEKTMVREGIEEIAFYKDGKIYVPKKIKSLGEQQKKDLENKILGSAKKYRYKGKIYLIDNELPEGGKIVHINKASGNETIEKRFSEINIDPRTNGIDVIGTLYVSLSPKKLGEYKPFDSEGFGRDVVAVKTEYLKDLINGEEVPAIIFHSNGEIEKKDINYPMTPPAMTATKKWTKMTDGEIIWRSIEDYYRTHRE